MNAKRNWLPSTFSTPPSSDISTADTTDYATGEVNVPYAWAGIKWRDIYAPFDDILKEKPILPGAPDSTLDPASSPCHQRRYYKPIKSTADELMLEECNGKLADIEEVPCCLRADSNSTREQNAREPLRKRFQKLNQKLPRYINSQMKLSPLTPLEPSPPTPPQQSPPTPPHESALELLRATWAFEHGDTGKETGEDAKIETGLGIPSIVVTEAD
ncbi:hypothetical protein F4818DRAFT_360845 [Hypoxylon cercidicola]|nr:hypothetical protein F4818DRAFT_360845 [Hypoxylon cercidicola]